VSKLPDCMMPDGADPCIGYKELAARVAELEAQLALGREQWRQAHNEAVAQAERVSQLEVEVKAHKWLARDASLRTYDGLAQENARLWEALRAANELISEFNSYSTGCSCLAEPEVAELFGKYTEALEAAETRQVTQEETSSERKPCAHRPEEDGEAVKAASDEGSHDQDTHPSGVSFSQSAQVSHDEQCLETSRGGWFCTPDCPTRKASSNEGEGDGRS